MADIIQSKSSAHIVKAQNFYIHSTFFDEGLKLPPFIIIGLSFRFNLSAILSVFLLWKLPIRESASTRFLRNSQTQMFNDSDKASHILT